MNGVRESTFEPRVLTIGGAVVAAEVDLSIYSLRTVLRACYKFTNNCYVFIARTEDGSWISVSLRAKGPDKNLVALVGEFFNELLDQQVRENLEKEMQPVRELIVAQAFAEGNLLDPLRDEGNYEEDPLGIGGTR
jgi:His-Xaa-Ser system protein HxsD